MITIDADAVSDLLSDPEVIAQRDRGRLLWALAGAGAQVRHAEASAADVALDRLRLGHRPRAVLLVGDPATREVPELLAAMIGGTAPAVVVHGTDLPSWVGPADALLSCCLDDHDQRVLGLLEAADRRGLAVAAVAGRGAEVPGTGRAALADLPDGTLPRAARWAVLTPLMLAAAELDVLPLSAGLLSQLADALDAVAEQCRPSGDVFTNPAKALAVEFAESSPVIAGAGSLPGAAAALFAGDLRLMAATAAVPVTLPAELSTAGSLLAGIPEAADAQDTARHRAEDDFFRDRVSEVLVRPRLVLIGGDEPVDGTDPGALAAWHAADALRRIASDYGVRHSGIGVAPGSHPIVALAAAGAFGSFTAAYLALGAGLDPGAPRPGELPGQLLDRGR